MALDANEIARLRAGVPDIYRPRDPSGALSQRYRDLETFNLSLAFIGNPDNAESSNPGFRLSGGLARIREAQIERARKDEREKSDRFSFAQAKAELDRRIAELDAELAAIDKRLEEIRVRRAEIGETMEALDELDELRRRGKLDPKNPRHAKLLKQAGISEDEARGDLAAVIAKRRGDLDREDGGLQTEWNTKMKRREVVIAERAGAIAARDELAGASTDEARILAERRAQTALGRRELAVAVYDGASAPAKTTAADAVASTEIETRRDESREYNRKSAAGDRAGVLSEDGASFELDAPAPKARPPAPT